MNKTMTTNIKIYAVIATVAVFGTNCETYCLSTHKTPRGADLPVMDLFQKLT
jgi:hypothetical protein